MYYCIYSDSCLFEVDICCGFGEVICVDELRMRRIIVSSTAAASDVYEREVVGKAMATPASINIFILTHVYFGETYAVVLGR